VNTLQEDAMTTKQGSVALLNDPVAQELLQSRIPARFAYNWTDGTPRVEPIWFHWDGKQVVMASPGTAPKAHAIKSGDKVAITIDTESFPAKVLMIRGTAEVTMVDGVAPEYAMAAERYFGKEGAQAWLGQLAQMGFKSMVRVAVTPEWVGILDFDKRYPSAIEKAMAGMQAA
jgi:hypothetical protein